MHILLHETLQAVLNNKFMERLSYKVPIHLLKVPKIPVKLLAVMRLRFKNAGYQIIHASGFYLLGHCMMFIPRYCRGDHYHYHCLVMSMKGRQGGRHKACHMTAFEH